MLLNQRMGLVMIIASLLVMGSTVFFMFDSQRSAKEELARTQGLGLARLLSGMAWDELVPGKNRKGVLEALYQGQSNPDFAYGVLEALDGSITNEVTARGVIVPAGKMPSVPADWLGQRELPSRDQSASFIESYAPVFSNGVHQGYVRLGYFKPELTIGYKQMPDIAMATLPIFLLLPLFYFILRHDVKPLKDISNSIEKLIETGGKQTIELQPGGQLGDFMERFNTFIEMTQSQIQSLSKEQNDLHMSGKLLAYQNNRVDAILQNIPDAILVIDKTGEISYVNDKLPPLFGVDRDEIVEKNFRQWCEDPQLISLLAGSANATGFSTLQESLQLEQIDGQRKMLQVSTYPLFSPTDESQVLGRLVVFRDVTESNMTTQRQSDFFAHIAHELKTPLNVLSMYSESLLDEGLNNEEYRIEAVNVIHDEVERLSTLINNLLAINQYELGGVVIDREHVRIHDLLEDVFNNITQGRRDSAIKFDLDIPREISAVSVDKDMLRIAINNLLTNAVKYSDNQGEVSLSAVETEQKIEITVKDSGIGISEEDQSQIFDKFFRSNHNSVRQQTGHGLGLSLANQIVQMHHGVLSLSSELGEGSSFTITLDKIKPQFAEVAAV